MLSKLIVAETKAKKICGVCGDKAKSYHFGGVSCDSCKAFFRRSVQNDAYKLFQCSFNGTCDITMVNRKCCQFCRFRKCLQIGMETSWVMTEEERMNMLQARHWKRGKRNKNETTTFHNNIKKESEDEVSGSGATVAAALTSPSRRKKPRLTSPVDREFPERKPCSEDHFTDDLAAEELAQIETLLTVFQSCFESKFNFSMSLKNSSKWLLIVVFIVSIQRLVRFASSFDLFTKVSIRDQVTLLRTNVFEMFLIVHFSGYAAFDSIDNGISCETPPSSCFDEASSQNKTRCPFLDAANGDVETPFNDDKAVRLLFRSAVNDKVILILLLFIILFNTDSNELSDVSVIESNQTYFCNLLGKYLKCKTPNKRFGLPKLLMLLPVLREMREKHVSFYFNLCEDDEDVHFSRNDIFNLIENGVF